MITIVEPKEHIDKLWGKQKIREAETYRLMRYVLRVDHEDKVLLHNVVTGRLVVLEREEAEALANLPAAYSPTMEQLVTEHYLVPENYDEHQQVVNLRNILFRLEEVQEKTGIISYTIFPTTACNARCYYCFEQGCETTTMTEQTANDVVDFIANHCNENRKVFITWFGGEPTVASHRIDQISEGLQKNSIAYDSCMITNGYLFDEEMAKKARMLWCVRYVQICVDGTEESTNNIKAYVGVEDNPYERVMRNIGLLLKNRIRVVLRMNYDVDNCDEFKYLCKEAVERFGNDGLLLAGAHAVIGKHKDHEGNIHHGSDDWFTDKQVELNEISRKMGLQSEKKLPYLNAKFCGACKDYSAVITPEGRIVKCPEQFGDDQIVGLVKTGITNHDLILSWKKVADYQMCIECSLFPLCTKLTNCSNKTYCHNWKSNIFQYRQRMVNSYDTYLKGEEKNELSGTSSTIYPD